MYNGHLFVSLKQMDWRAQETEYGINRLDHVLFLLFETNPSTVIIHFSSSQSCVRRIHMRHDVSQYTLMIVVTVIVYLHYSPLALLNFSR